MKEIIYEIEVEGPSDIVQLPVNSENIIELDLTYLEEELDAEGFDDMDDDFFFDEETDDDFDEGTDDSEDLFDDLDL